MYEINLILFDNHRWITIFHTYDIQRFATLTQVTDIYSPALIAGNSIKTNYNLFYIWNWLLCLTKVPVFALIFGQKLRTDFVSMLWQWHDPNHFEDFFLSFCASWMLKWVKINWGKKIMGKLCQNNNEPFSK